MVHVAKAAAFLAALYLAGASSCSGDKCHVEDEISLMQFQKSVKSGSVRGGKSEAEPAHEVATELAESLQEVETEKFTLQETLPTVTPGCVDQGCIGSGPNCGGNSFDCTSNGWTPVGWYTACSTLDTCLTGYKVRCAACPAGVGAAVPMPAPVAGAAAWVAPVAPTLAPPPPPVAPAAPVMPTGAPQYIAPPFDANAVATKMAALDYATANVTLLKQNLAAATKLQQTVDLNVSAFADKENQATRLFKANRQAAVNYAKKVALANVTLWKAKIAMSSAYYAQKGAAQGAQDSLVNARNSAAQKRYYQKQLVDQREATKQAQIQLQIGNTAVAKAQADLAQANKFAMQNNLAAQSQQQRTMAQAASDSNLAQGLSVQNGMQQAFVDASDPTLRDLSNIPPFGQWA